MATPKSARLLLLAAVVVSALGCSGDGEPDASTAEEPAAQDSADNVDTGTDDEDGLEQPECELPDDLVQTLGQERQLVLNLALAEGGNFETVASAGLPESGTFRSVADALGGLDLSGIPSNPNFDGPDDIVADLHETADLLDAALAAGADTTDPAWSALSEFYTQDFFTRHNASVGYYLTEAGCV
ncbi:MAG TPA: hypothetical protein VFZ37_01645 [Jiangellaceae bacterium]